MSDGSYPRKTPENCPVCGAEVPARALACPECGADEKTGWSAEAASSGLDLPEESFDYDEFIEREFGQKERAGRRFGAVWWGTAVLLVVLIAWWLVAGLLG
jgi:hypothetical protein